MANPVRQMAIPFGIDLSGRIAYVTDPAQQLADRLAQVVCTALGARVMHPDFGLDVGSLLFTPIDDETSTLLGVQVQTALALWEPSAVLRSVAPRQNLDTGEVGIEIQYTTALPGAIGSGATQSTFVVLGAST